jgi:hypothetical protein
VAPLERAVHEALWLAGRVRLRRRGHSHALPPASARHVTTILRVPAEVGATIEPVLARLRRLDPGHHYYPPDALHVTVVNLDRLRAPLEGIPALVSPHRPLELEARGLSLSPTSVFVRVHVLGPALRDLRNDLRGLPHERAGLRGVLSRRLLGAIAFANVARFSGPVGRPFLDEVARLRRHDFGRWTASEVELVETDRLLSAASTRVLARMPLTGRA